MIHPLINTWNWTTWIASQWFFTFISLLLTILPPLFPSTSSNLCFSDRKKTEHAPKKTVKSFANKSLLHFCWPKKVRRESVFLEMSRLLLLLIPVQSYISWDLWNIKTIGFLLAVLKPDFNPNNSMRFLQPHVFPFVGKCLPQNPTVVSPLFFAPEKKSWSKESHRISKKMIQQSSFQAYIFSKKTFASWATATFNRLTLCWHSVILIGSYGSLQWFIIIPAYIKLGIIIL